MLGELLRSIMMLPCVIGVLSACSLPGDIAGLLPQISISLPQPGALAALQYQPSPQVQQLADDATMTDQARRIFYSAQPVIDLDRTAFDQHCQAPVSSTSVELGCYTSANRIFILNIAEPKLHYEMVVIAAHELI